LVKVVEKILTTAKTFKTAGSKIIVIPKKLRIKLGEENTDPFMLKLDGRGRIILEPIKKEL